MPAPVLPRFLPMADFASETNSGEGPPRQQLFGSERGRSDGLPAKALEELGNLAIVHRRKRALQARPAARHRRISRFGQEDVLHDEMFELGERLAYMLDIGVRHRRVLAHDVDPLELAAMRRVRDLEGSSPAALEGTTDPVITDRTVRCKIPSSQFGRRLYWARGRAGYLR